MTQPNYYTGIDEAGRGCVLGPMVVAALSLPREGEKQLEGLGICDSKKITRSRREKLFDTLYELEEVVIQIKEISADEINRGNLNQLTKDAVCYFAQGAPGGTIFLDVPAPPRGVETYLQQIRDQAGSEAHEITGDNKGEDRFPVVAAASIIAKVHRDRCLDSFRDGEMPFGSGYPSDPKTRSFLEEILRSNAPMPSFVRTRWKTVAKLRQQTLDW